MRVHNFVGLFGVILVINKQCLYSYKWWLIGNDQNLGNVILEFLVCVHNFAGLVRVILDKNK